MTFKPAIWYPIAAVLSVVNLAAIWFAAAPGEPAHATLHGALAVAFQRSFVGISAALVAAMPMTASSVTARMRRRLMGELRDQAFWCLTA